MSEVKAPFKLRLKNSFSGIVKTFSHPLYVMLAVIFGFLITGLIIWALNLDLLRFTLFESGFDLETKMQILWDVQTGIYSAYSSLQATGIIVFGFVFGINFSLIIKVIRSGSLKNIPKKSGSTGLVLAVISGGCVACGTSILAPLLATFTATASVSVSELSNTLNWISVLLILYSIYKLGGVINNSSKVVA